MSQKEEAEFYAALKQFSVSEIVMEFELFKRLIYKSNNQHNSAHYFKKIQFTKRIFIKIIQIHTEIYKNVQQPNTDITFSISLYETKLNMLVDFTKLLSKADQVLKETYLALKQVASQTYFMSICMTFMGVTARLFYLMNLMKENTNLLYQNILCSYERCMLKSQKIVDYNIFPTSIQRITESKTLQISGQIIIAEEINDTAINIPENDLVISLQKKSTVLYDMDLLEDVKPKSKSMSKDSFFDQIEKPFKVKKKAKLNKAKKKKSDDIDDIFSNL
jgi:hypothetical protein